MIGYKKSCLCLIAALVLLPIAASASDHADPILLLSKQANITGLFAWPEGDNTVIILTVQRKLPSPTGPYKGLDDFEYTVHLDKHSAIHYRDKENNHRYGGTVRKPEGISADVTIKFRLTEDASLASGYPEIEGLGSGPTPQAAAGVFDDPFIFPRFFGHNVIGMAVSIPNSRLPRINSAPPGHEDYLLWATTTKPKLFGGRKQIDHVGRSARTQLGRFDFLNKVPPNEHVAKIKSVYSRGQVLVKGVGRAMKLIPPLASIGDLAQYVLLIRDRGKDRYGKERHPYDFYPDVMIYSAGRPSGYPNGRRLTDDVVGKTCEVGDCVLQEVASYEGDYPRATENDKDFSDTFPYLAPPHLDQEEEEPDHTAGAVLVVLVVLIILWIDWCKRRKDRFEKPYVRRVE